MRTKPSQEGKKRKKNAEQKKKNKEEGKRLITRRCGDYTDKMTKLVCYVFQVRWKSFDCAFPPFFLPFLRPLRASFFSSKRPVGGQGRGRNIGSDFSIKDVCYIYICLFACFFVPSSNFCFPHHAHVFFFPFSLFLAICPLTVLEAVRTSNEEKFSAGGKTKASTTQQYVSVYVFSRICVLTYCFTPIQLMHLFPVFLYSLCCIAVKFTLTMPAVMIFFFFSPLLSSSSSPFLSLVFAVASFLTAMRITILYRPHGHALTLPPLLLQMSPADTPVSP